MTGTRKSENPIRRAHEGLGKRISQLRKKKGLSQEHQCNMPIGRIASMERGQGQTAFRTLVAIAGELQTNVYQLLKGIA